jgi:hypothetical protein
VSSSTKMVNGRVTVREASGARQPVAKAVGAAGVDPRRGNR